MALECENCGEEPTHPTYVRQWTEYLVGATDGAETFYFCPSCEDDDSIDPRDQLYVIKL